MRDTARDVKRTPVRRDATSDEWRSFLDRLDRLFDHFDAGFHRPSSRRIADLESLLGPDSALGAGVAAADTDEDDKTDVRRRASRRRPRARPRA